MKKTIIIASVILILSIIFIYFINIKIRPLNDIELVVSTQKRTVVLNSREGLKDLFTLDNLNGMNENEYIKDSFIIGTDSLLIYLADPHKEFYPYYSKFNGKYSFVANLQLRTSKLSSNIVVINQKKQLVFQLPNNYLQDIFLSDLDMVQYIGFFNNIK